MNVSQAIRAAQDPERLAVLRQIRLLDTPTEEAFDRLTRLASNITNSPISLVSLVDANRQFFKSQIGLPEPLATIRQTPLSHSFCKHVVAENAPLIVEDARKDPVLKDNLAIPDLGVVGYLGMPLTTTDGIGLGSFCVIDTAPRKWTTREIEVMYKVAFLVMTEIELRAQVEARRQAERALQQYADTLEFEVAERTWQLRLAYERLQGIDRLKSKFIDDISHELRTPVANIILYLTLLSNGRPEKKTQYLSVLQQQGQLLKKLVEDIIQYSEMDSGRDQVAFSKVNLNDIVADVVSERQGQLEGHNTKLAFVAHSNALPVSGNREQLRRMIASLVDNAVQYTPQGEVQVSTALIGGSEEACLLVEDNGIGITPEDTPHLFERFYRGAGASQSNLSGIGLGLTLVKEIVDLHNGQIEVKSEPGNGSQFCIRLPLA